MSALPRLNAIDKWIFAMIAFSVVSIILATRFAHTHRIILGDFLFFFGFTSLFALPSIAGPHIYFNSVRTESAILWVESTVVGILVMLATQVLALEVFGDTTSAVLSLGLGIAFMSLPLFSHTRTN
jgi:uncharacterized membrane protein